MRSQSAPRPRRPVVREVLLWLAAAVGAITATAAALALTLGITPIVFMSGSMAPTIEVGALALSQKTAIADVIEGDIITFTRGDGARVTHRAEAVTVGDDGGVAIITKGDANDAIDDQPVVSAEVGRVVWSAPGLGYLATEMLRPQWAFAGGVGIGMIALFGFRRRLVAAPVPPLETPGGAAPASSAFSPARVSPSEMLFLTDHSAGEPVIRPRARRRVVGAVSASAATAAIAALIVAASISAPESTLAAFSDSGSIGTISMSAAAEAPGTIDQDSIACSGTAGTGFYNQTISWSAPSPAASHYTVTVRSANGAHTFVSITTGTSVTIRMPRSAVDQWGNPIDSNTSYYTAYSIKITGTSGSATSTPTYRTLAYAHWSPSNCYYAAQTGG